MEDNNNNIPAAGEQVIFNETPENKPEETAQTETPQAEMPQVETPQAEIPQVETPQVENVQQQYQQTPPPNNYQYQNQQQNQQQYNPIPPNPVSTEPDTNPMTMGEWMVTLLLMCIPCVNIILLFVWAFGDKTGNLNRKNYAKAQLIIMGIVMALYLLVVIIMAVAIGASYAY